MADSVFLKPLEYYQRRVNPIQDYVHQNAFYLGKMTGKDLQVCKEFVVSGLKTRRFQGVTDPVVTYFERDDNQDRSPQQITLNNYINSVIREQQILAPTFTTYLPPSQKKSLLVEFIDMNVKGRSIAKKQAAAAKAEGKKELFILKNNEQDNKKRTNNSMSGAFVAGGSVINNPTGHSTLTSITRTLSSLSNASNEKIIAGNRHYRNAKVTLSNLISLTSTLEREPFQSVMDKYKLHYPSAEEVMECVHYSSDLYWRDGQAMKSIQEYVLKLDPLERAAIVYIGDCYHIRKYNDAFMRMFLSELSRKVTDVQIEDPLKVISSIDEQVINYMHLVCMDDVRGVGKNYKQIPEHKHHWLAATSLNIVSTVEKYRDFVNVIFLSDNLPASTAYISNMVRRTVVLSDTDSTMFAVDDWVSWYFGELKFEEKHFALAGAMMFIATQCIAHSLAVFSANMGVERSRLLQAAMKPEYCFPVFALSSVAKHYYTMVAIKEGSVYSELEMEIKGVHLKNSASPRELISNSHKEMQSILKSVMRGDKLSLYAQIKRVAEVERSIQTSLLSGQTKYYKTSKIKNPEAYAVEAELSPYQHHIFWKEVFGPKYGVPEAPPYGVIKIPTTVTTKTALKNWMDSIEDVELRTRFQAWITRKRKESLPTLYFSKQYVQSFGLPKEVISVIDVKRIVLDLTTPDRMILESLGYFPKSLWTLTESGY